MAEGKWISELSGATPLPVAARRVLAARLEAVRAQVPLVAAALASDPEHVHQLRVATRRARAALDIFAPCLPAKIYKHVKKRLRTIRRAAGDARDWDVFLGSLQSGTPKILQRQRPGIDLLTGYALGRRALAQGPLDVLAQQSEPEPFGTVVAEAIAAVEAAEDVRLQTLFDLAQPLLLSLVRELDVAATANLDDYVHLHQIRIIGKRLRYAMEVFADCFAPSFRTKLYPAIEEMQETLGLANDSHVAVGRLDAALAQVGALSAGEAKRWKPGLAALRKFHADRLPQQVEQFKEWWSNWQKSGGERALVASLRLPVKTNGHG